MVPSEGTAFWLDTWVMLTDAPRPGGVVRLAELHPAAGDPGRGDELQPVRHAQRRRQGSSCKPEILATRRSSRRTRRWRSSRASRTPRAAPSATTSGRSSSRRSAGSHRPATRTRRRPDGRDRDAAPAPGAGREPAPQPPAHVRAPAAGRGLVPAHARAAARDRGHLLVRHPGEERRLRSRRSCSTTTSVRSRRPTRSSRACRCRSPARSAVPPRGAAARVLPGDAGRPQQEHALLLLVVPFWTSFLIRTYAWLIILGPNLGLAGSIETLFGVADVQILGTLVRGPARPRLRLPAADGVPAVRDARAHGPDADRGVQGPRRRPLGDVPPGHAADHAARARAPGASSCSSR